jgi:UDP-sugar transporter A1/2/3
MCIISGYSSVYFEGMLKNTDLKLGVWHRNFQLAFYSVIFLYCVILWEFFNDNLLSISTHPIMFQGWSWNTVLITLVQSGGGLLVAASLKYSDAIMKTLATSGAIFLSAVLGKLLLNSQLDMFVTIGGVTTILAIFNYSSDATT